MPRQLSKQESQEQLSTMMSLVTILGLIIPGLIVWGMSKLHVVTAWLLDKGMLEQSDRVIWSFNDGVGLDLGRICMLVGISLLVAVCLLWIAKWTLSLNAQQNAHPMDR